MAKRFMPVPEYSKVYSKFGARWGTWHRGTDFGKDGGSANMPVFAAQSGKVVFTGAAQGFGGPDPAGWVVIDHPTESGSGTTVYGHIIREVERGQWVEAGQRIGRVNPNSGTNGGVAPHLHFEVHPTVWVPGSQIDPEVWLAGAPHPGASTPSKSEVSRGVDGVIYGVDISNHQNGISGKRIRDEGFSFGIIKATEGTWRDPIFRSHYDDLKSTGMLVGAYVYVRGETSPQAHADTLHAVVGDTSVPIALDIEDGSGSSVAHFKAIRDAIEAKGYRVFLTYLPRWYWDKIGRPDLSGLPPLWTSNYPDYREDYATAIYNRAGNRGWEGYGGLDVAVWQFTSSAKVAGRAIDANAYRGSFEDLERLFGQKTRASEILGGLFSMLSRERQEELARKIDDIHYQVHNPHSQLGYTSKGEPLTLVDGVAAARRDIATIFRELKAVRPKKGVFK